MKKIIPAIDLYNRKVVRLIQGDFNKRTTYSDDPLKILHNFIRNGIEDVHIIDLNGAEKGNFEKSPNQENVVSLLKECEKWGVKVQIGGGIRSESTIDRLIALGAKKIIIGTIAFGNSIAFSELIRAFKDHVIIALDIFNGKIKIKGWIEEVENEIETHLRRFEEKGVSSFIVTDISRDGTLNGPNVRLYKWLSTLKKPDSEIIASGGINSLNDIYKVLEHVDGVIIGKALYNNKITDQDFQILNNKYNPTYLTKRIIPCLDIKDGRVVKGIKFAKLRDSGDPVELARFYNIQGADELVFLDISATLEERESIIKVIREVAEEVYIPFTVGGGIRTLSDMMKIINAGAEKVCINTAAIKNPKIIEEGSKKFGTQSIVVAIDVKKINNSWKVYAKSGTEATGIDAIDWAKETVRRGAGELLITSIDKDGTQTGYDLELISILSKMLPVPIIASGGAGDYEHFYQAINHGAEAVLAASLFHSKIIKIPNLKSYLLMKNVKIRI